MADAKVVASLRGISMAEFLTETLRPIVRKALAAELRKRVEGASRDEAVTGRIDRGEAKGGS